jgi:hypothetical protein
MRLRILLGLTCLSCGQSAPACPASGVLVVTTDYMMSSEVGVLPLDGTPAVLLSGNDLGADPALATSAGRHFFIARDRDTIYEIDSCGRATNQWSARAPGEVCPLPPRTPGNCNPQDVAVASDGSLWIARFNVPSLLIAPPPGSTALDNTVDFSAFDKDGDGNPEMSSVRIVGNRAFIALERLTQQTDGNYLAQQPSQIAVLDTTSLAVVSTVTLAGRNPFGLMVEAAGMFWLADMGDIGTASEPDAGIEVFDTQALTSKLVLTKTQLGASPVEVRIDGTCGVAILADASSVNSTSLVSFTTDGSNLKTVISPTGNFDLRGLLWTPSHELLVGDKRAPFVVHTFMADATCTLTRGTDLALPSMPALAFAN